ncbi:alpha/beta hydrolase [Pseudoxanthomonas composti]|uniref:Alpha/beta hydrolase n=1 Tax=Pseudoxanthomonas composti TaxID=2137479 RepID=A0A4Q1JZE1_9GAMM|nr:alpha/beta hydrolase [Pseudoxanthomonas composti]RXR08262.1 alpha/beta hydrolase [Pseudoxanthomonas composti]
MEHVSFSNRGITVAADLHLPTGFDAAGSYPALVIATPGSSVKEQIGAVYASRLARAGFIALTFDPSYQGASGGQPRDLEDPAVRVEDIRCAVDYLMTRPFVAEERVGLLGICAGGGYAIKAALTEHRVKAVGTVVANDIGQAFRDMSAAKGMADTLRAVGWQRTHEARGGAHRRNAWIPDSLQQAQAEGVSDPELLEAVGFYRESSYRHPGSTNRLLFSSYAQLLSFNAFDLVPDLLTQPLQVVVGGKRGNTGQYEAGRRLYERSPATDKDLYVVEGAGHYDLYHVPQYVEPAVARLAAFFSRHLDA